MPMSSSQIKFDVLKLVAEIKKHPFLYDSTSPDHTDRNKTAEVWEEISNILDLPVRDCKEKWRKIRIAFGRFLKVSKSSTPPTKAYYLSEHLQFLVPFMKTINGPASPGDHHQNTNKKDTEVNLERVKDEYVSDEEEIVISEYNYEEGPGDAISDDYLEPKEDVAPKKAQKREYNTAENNEDTMSPRKMFLLSLLPDVESLTEQEMRLFRKRTIIAIDDIINARDIKTDNNGGFIY